MRTPRRRRAQAGFSMTELLMAIVIASIFAGALYGFFFAGTDAARSHESTARAQSGGRLAIERLTRDVRQAISQDDGATPPVESVGATSLVLYADPSRDPTQLDSRPERVRYRLLGGDLVREFAAPVGGSPPYSYGPFGGREVLVEEVQNGGTAIFTARGLVGTLTNPVSGTAARQVELLSIHLIIGVRTGVASSTTEMTTDVALRNNIPL